MKRIYYFLLLISSLFLFSPVFPQNVIIVVLDGARYSETFGADSLHIKNIWTKLRPIGSVFTNFRNDGITSTVPGHSSIETGTWQTIDNNGKKRPTEPTIFEYYRKIKMTRRTENYVIAGKKKLKVLTHSSSHSYGRKFKAAFSLAEGDPAVLDSVLFHMGNDHPRLMVINFPDIDAAGHAADWKRYCTALGRADSLVYLLWQRIQSDPIYKDKTTLFITNDHGRHDDAHGGFKDHGDSCEGCRHIMLLMTGKNVPRGVVDSLKAEQIDIAPTVGELLGFPTPFAAGKSLFHGRLDVKK